MFHIFPNIFGGFDVCEDLLGDGILAGVGLFFIVILVLVSIVEAILVDLTVFLTALVLLLLALLIMICCSGEGTFPFLGAVSPFLLNYSLVSFCCGINENATQSSLGFLAVVSLLLIFLIGACGIVFSIMLVGEGQGDITAMGIVLLGGVVYGFLLGFAFRDPWFYVFRVAAIATGIWMAFLLIKWCKAIKIDAWFARQLLSNLLYCGLGSIPLAIIAIGGAQSGGKAQAVVLFALVFAVYAALGGLISGLYDRNKDAFSGNIQFVFVPYVVINIAMLSQNAVMNVSSEVVSALLPILRNGPFSAQLAAVSQKSASMFADVFTPPLNGIVALIMRIFDTEVPYFTLPTASGPLIGLVSIAVALSVGARVYVKVFRNRPVKKPDPKPAVQTKNVKMSPVRPVTPVRVSASVQSAVPGRNEPCICGSGKRYGKCCGAKLKRSGAVTTAGDRKDDGLTDQEIADWLREISLKK